MSQKLVAYFSGSGQTQTAANKIAKILNCDIYEIKPKIKYSTKDLNYNDPNSRTSIECKNRSCRPELADKNANISKYDTIIIGFPVWWYIAPTIVNTFLEANDLSGKRIVLFATSGGSDFGKTVQFLKNSVASDTVISEGRVFSGRFEDNDVVEFARQYI